MCNERLEVELPDIIELPAPVTYETFDENPTSQDAIRESEVKREATREEGFTRG